MRKMHVAILLVFYTIFNVGLVVNAHYCGGKLASVSLLSSTNNAGCGMCGRYQMSANCCKDTQIRLVIEDTQQQTQQKFKFSNPFFLSYILQKPYCISIYNPYYINKSPGQFYVFETGPPKTPLYIQIQSLLV